MSRRVLAAVPIKPFGVAKARLAPLLAPPARAALGRAIAARTVSTVAESASMTAVVTGDPGVARWAARLGVEVLEEIGTGLDGAAATVVAAAADRGMPWAIVHADLPLLRPADLDALLAAAAAGQAGLAPSWDGGTSVLAGAGGFRFAYGPGSFHRHLRTAAGSRPLVSSRVGTAVDLDRVEDLRRVVRHPRGGWIAGYLP